MYIGNFEIGKQEISIALMILFAMTAMFFIGYKYAYNKAIAYANEQIEDGINEYKMRYGMINNEDNMDFILGNVNLSDLEGTDDEE